MTRAILLGDSDAMSGVHRAIAQLSGCDASLLVCGEHGTGKSLIARAVHESSYRADGPLVHVNFSALRPEEHASRLFGERNEPGALVQADTGTLVIAEPEAMHVELQASLVRALDERAVVNPHGAIAFDVRMIATTTRRLEHLCVLGDFDRELYDHFATVVLAVPPLRARGCDILQLASHFVRRASGGEVRGPFVSAAASRQLLRYNWPGNVRELENAVEEASRANTTGRIEVSNLPERVLAHQQELTPPAGRGLPSLDDVERRHIAEVLAAVDGNKSRASRVLGVDRRTLYRKLRKLGLSTENPDASMST